MTVPPVDPKISAHCDHRELRVQLAQADQAQVCQVRLAILLPPRQFAQLRAMAFDVEGQPHQACLQQPQYQAAVL